MFASGSCGTYPGYQQSSQMTQNGSFVPGISSTPTVTGRTERPSPGSGKPLRATTTGLRETRSNSTMLSVSHLPWSSGMYSGIMLKKLRRRLMRTLRGGLLLILVEKIGAPVGVFCCC
ncbi:uncharacterized protein LOC133857354 isoform X1 [Alnus glutinosa]|uniref:uncharacterized protein LOC133857354 isoform X1 n=1 Tax=Alnus glutinosa TaxID=3517 RepID=UPI002D77B84C|nr:uncharacterized protein LOC133857354 isoform X1 [Alnus glutinosa]